MPLVVVNGATGNTGKAVALHALEHKDKYDVRVVVRSEEKGAEFKAKGAQVVVADWDDAEALKNAQQGADSIWVTPPNPTKQQKAYDRINSAKKVVDAAQTAGVKHILVGSVAGASYEAVTFGKEFREFEKYVEASGLDYTHFGMAAFIENVIGSKQALENGVYPQPLGKGKYAPVSIEDIGEAAAHVWLDIAPHKGKTYTLTGPESLTGEEQAAAVGRALGKEIKYVDADPVETENVLKTFMADYQAAGMIELYNLFQTGATDSPSPDFKTITGKDGTTIEQRVSQLHQYGVL
jgi:uncharacterized protein YbjT (DUF2867 family)